MSLDNSVKRNLFELKSQSRYAQLVETQSPELKEADQEPIKQQQAPVTKNNSSTSAKSTPLNSSSGKQQGTSLQAQQQMSLEQTQTSDTSRKVSQCSSQVSTSFMSSQSSQPGTSSTEPCLNQSLNLTVIDRKNRNKYTSSNNNNNSFDTNQELKMHRTISQSMLELDQSARLDKFEVSWHDLSFSYAPNRLLGFRKRPTRVLRNISGRFKSNQLIAIIGPSGCGKTTLLQFLAGNNPTEKERLRIVGLDEPKVAFIGQGDCLLPGLTARETLVYASRLQNSLDKTINHNDHIQSILNALGLDDCSDRNVTKLSGGQMKRVTIAQELLYPTNILILDEVTSGLDTSTSFAIVQLLKQLVSDKSYPMSIVMSIHQPSAKLFAVFDQVYVMSEGCCLYQGSCEVDIVNRHLSQFGLECPKFHNIADYLIEIASEDLYACDSIKDQMVAYQWKKSLLQDETFEVSSEQLNDGEESSEIECEDNSQQEAMLMNNNLYDAVERARGRRVRPLLTHFSIHFSRSFLRIRRSYILTYLQLITYIILGLQLATFYGFNIGTLSGCPRLPISFMSYVFSNEAEVENLNSESRRIQENMNFLLVSVMTATFAALEITVITFPLEAKTIKREWRNGVIDTTSYVSTLN